MKNTMRKMCVVAGLMVGTVAAQAFPSDAQIMIDRALNSPTLTVKYHGAHAALVELRVNGESLGTRTVTASKDTGETNFTLILSDLKDGDNDVEVRLFDRTGKLVGTEHTNISTEQTLNAPVYLTTPKVGQTVIGDVTIKMGFGETLKNVYVSFFVDNNIKSMKNFPPYEYDWDSTKETNGWHEVEAWAIDEASSTYKTRKIKVFVNNPGGRTDRPGVDITGTPSVNPSNPDVTGADVDQIRSIHSTGKPSLHTNSEALAPAIRHSEVSTNSSLVSVVDAATGEKPIRSERGIATGVRQMLPTGTRVAKSPQTGGFAVSMVNPKTKSAKHNLGDISIIVRSAQPALGPVADRNFTIPPAQVFNGLASASSLIPITHGQRIPNLGAFAVILNSEFVNFDVPTRVDDGVPMAPFRHLIEKSGGSVDWTNTTKTVDAKADGHDIWLQIGDKTAKINKLDVSLDLAPYIDHGRTIVPISFMRNALNVDVQYDKTTGHVLITSVKK